MLLVFLGGSLAGLGYVAFPPAPRTILILGLDARDGNSALSNTDSVLLVRIDPRAERMTLLSIPRDIFVEVPGYGERRLNTVHLLGEQDQPGRGPELVRKSLEHSFAIRIDHYIRVDFNAFVALIDAVGGVDIHVAEPIVDTAYPTADGGTMTIRFESGRQHMDGQTALQFARTRHQDDDFRRASRQQQLVEALMHRLRSTSNIPRWPAAWRIMTSEADTDLKVWEIAALGPAVVRSWAKREQRVLDPEMLIEVRAGYWVPDYAQITPWLREHFQ